MRIAFLSAVFLTAVLAQQPADLFHKAPPAVDEALRARIAKFYQLHVDSKFRQAEGLVAEDSKDFFYSANKPKYMGYEIKDITYNDDFTKAKATVVTQMIVMVPGFVGKPLPVPVPSRWKVEHGEWCWYIDPEELNMTPFGKMKAGPGALPSGGGPPASIPTPEEAAKLLAGVKAEQTEAEIKLRQVSTVEYTIVNTMPGKVTLSLDPVLFPGITAKLDREELGANEKAHVSVEWRPSAYVPRALEFRVHVQPTKQVVVLRAKFVD